MHIYVFSTKYINEPDDFYSFMKNAQIPNFSLC